MKFHLKKFILNISSILFILHSTYCSAMSNQPSLQLQKWIIAQMQQYKIPGASIAVIKNYHIEWAKGFGFRDKAKRENVTVNTLFQAASISKPITAVAIMETFNEKNLSLDANINSILTSWKIPKNSYTFKQAVTMRLLLSHSAGIIGFRYKGYGINTKLPTLIEELNGTPPANTPPITVVRHPGTKYEYSPAGYTIIQQILIDICHKSFDKIIQLLIIQPLQMHHSTFAEPLPHQYLSEIALPYLPNGKLLPNGPLTFTAAAAGGLWTTPTDLAKFVIAIQKTLTGQTQVGITQNIINQMMQPQIDHNMGLGFIVNVNKYGEEVKGTGNYFMHGGFNSGYLSIMIGSLQNGDGIVIMVNSAPQNMSSSYVPQWHFLMNVVKKISDTENWKP